jgi:hypothetical protein
MARGDLKDHLNRCDKAPIKCPLCSQNLIKEESLIHLAFEHKNESLSKLELIFDAFKEKENNNSFSREGKINSNRRTARFNCEDALDGVMKINSKGRKAHVGSTGKFYCGDALDGEKCGCCDGICGPTSHCNCSACMKLDIEHKKLSRNILVNSDGANAKLSPQTRLFYCGRLLMLPRSDGFCGPFDGPNCAACKKLDDQTRSGGRYAHLIQRSASYSFQELRSRLRHPNSDDNIPLNKLTLKPPNSD